MLRFFLIACVLESLAACAAPPRPSVAAPAMPVGERATILAVRPVPASDPQAVQVLLARLGGGSPSTTSVEYVVQRQDGHVLDVVQAGTPALRPGAQVLILPGMQTHIMAIPAVAVR